ncbi:MAG: response regulator [Helicobacteraceae bacterium]|nr:response regulator [Helicobacteraceae bacterium]
MKILLLLALTLTLGFTKESQIVFGTYSTLKGAQEMHDTLNTFVQKNIKLKKFLDHNSITIKSKEYGKYFVTTLEPLATNADKYFVYDQIKDTFKDAYVLQLFPKQQEEIPLEVISEEIQIKEIQTIKEVQENQENDPLLADEPDFKNLPTKPTKNIAKIKQEDIIAPTVTKKVSKEEFNLVEEYFIEILATLALLILVVVYFFVKASQQKQKNRISEYNIEQKPSVQETAEIQEEEIQEENTQRIEPLEATDEIAPEALRGDEEGTFGVESSMKEMSTTSQEESETKNSSEKRKKRAVPPHAKISKANFTEFAGLRILVAEDNLINQKVINGLLADTGIELVMANDGKEALEVLEKDKDFKFVLMDAHMPRIDGFEATRRIRANPEYDHILVVALSGDTAADDVKKMQEAGMQEHLEKPLRMDALYDILYAYTSPNEEEESGEYVEVVMTQELNGDKGLSICGGDEAFYHEILDEFVRDYGDSAQKIHTFLESNQIQQADRLLLDILGISANIGADRLNEIAKDLKDALQDVEEKSYLSLVDQYEKHLTSLLEDIKSYK